MSVGKRIVELRKKMNMTARELADIAGVTPATISRYEHDKMDISADMIRRLSSALNVSEEYLILDDPKYAFMINSQTQISSSLKKEEAELLRGYRKLSPELQDIVRRLCNLHPEN
ncbi:MAG: helix-turn-helix transcriptional regulator [Solobacterium sp.]|nr:helix-turn-helix transcriptional regulator [Solobacterium sp.]